MRLKGSDIIVLIIITMFSLAACVPGFGGMGVPPTETLVPDPTVLPAGPRLRIVNAGEHDITGLVVIFPDSRIVFGGVPAGATTIYLDAPSGVYNYAAYQYVMDGTVITQPVIDWVGESPRPGSDFTYTLTFRPQNPEMQRIELVTASVDR